MERKDVGSMELGIREDVLEKGYLRWFLGVFSDFILLRMGDYFFIYSNNFDFFRIFNKIFSFFWKII